MRPDLTATPSDRLLARLAEVAVLDADAARRIAHAFHDMHAAMGECRCNGPYATSNHALEYVVAQSTNARAKALLACITEIRRGILIRRQETTRIKIELQRRAGRVA